MLCRACYVVKLGLTSRGDNLLREEEAFVLGLLESVDAVRHCAGQDSGGRTSLTCGSVLVKTETCGSALCIAGAGESPWERDAHEHSPLYSPKPEGYGIVMVQPPSMSSLTTTRIYLKNICECSVKLYRVACSNSKLAIKTMRLFGLLAVVQETSS